MKDKIRWGILSTGGIAKTMARALATLPEADADGRRDEAAVECHRVYE